MTDATLLDDALAVRGLGGGAPRRRAAGDPCVLVAGVRGPKHEQLRCVPMSPYAVSNLAAESYAIAYAGCYDLPVLPWVTTAPAPINAPAPTIRPYNTTALLPAETSSSSRTAPERFAPG